jgi:hypothetical protein
MDQVRKVADFYVCQKCGRGVTYLRTGDDPFVYTAITGLIDSGTILQVQGEQFSAEC